MKRACLHWVFAALGLVGILGPAVGQHVWLDEKGVKHYSDQPPPPSVPKGRILKGPGAARVGQAAAAAPDTSTPDTAAPTTVAEKAPMTLAEKNADFQKRRMEQAEKEKKAAEEAKLAQDKAKACDRARSYQRVLESGQRVASTDKSGERIILSDEQRAHEMQETRRMLQEHNCT